MLTWTIDKPNYKDIRNVHSCFLVQFVNILKNLGQRICRHEQAKTRIENNFVFTSYLLYIAKKASEMCSM